LGIYYTYQHENAWKAALERGYLQGDPQYASFNDEGFEFFKPAYDWMVEQYEQRIGISLCGNYPVWCWDEFPDLSRGGHIGQGNKGVVLTVELPDDQVLASEISFWEFVPYHSTFCDTAEAFDHRENIDPAYTRKSWEKIFDKKWCEEMAIHRSIEAPDYQYVIHRIELHQVRAVMPFRDLDDRLMDRVRGLAWQLSFNLGLKKSIPFSLENQKR
jgi:hypothetical protein